MPREFSYVGSPARVVFGVDTVTGGTAVTEAMEQLGVSKALLLTTPAQAGDGGRLSSALGGRCVGLFSGAVMHTPVEVTERALAETRALGADVLVAFGGGSTVGLGKAIALRTDLPQIVIPTTYAGSEVTPILGQTENGIKTTICDARVLPEVVVYDPRLTLSLPVAMSVTSGLNAMAHAAEALYAQDRNPVASLLAAEGLRAMKTALPGVVAAPTDLDARAEALYGAWLCGSVLGSVGMALHHKICHTLGGSFDTPHAETHAVMLPHTVGFNAATSADLLRPLSELFGGPPGPMLYDFAASLGAPLALRELGLGEADLDRAAEIAVANPYWNPRPINQADIRELLQQAWEGERPAG